MTIGSSGSFIFSAEAARLAAASTAAAVMTEKIRNVISSSRARAQRARVFRKYLVDVVHGTHHVVDAQHVRVRCDLVAAVGQDQDLRIPVLERRAWLIEGHEKVLRSGLCEQH